MSNKEQGIDTEEIRRFFIKINELIDKEAPSTYTALNCFITAYVSLASYRKIPIEDVKDTFQKILNTYDSIKVLASEYENANEIKVFLLNGDPNDKG